MEVLLKMVRDTSFEKVLVFAETKQWVKKFATTFAMQELKQMKFMVINPKITG